MRRGVSGLLLGWSVVFGWASGEASPAAAGGVRFTRAPAALRAGKGARITFTVSQPTDVAVFVEDAKGKVVRHLAAGVLGPKAPAPLKPNSLEQTLLWDGKADYGREAGKGPFRVRVALGLRVTFDRVLIDSNRRGPRGIKALAVGPDGTLYVVSTVGGAVWQNVIIQAFDRRGRYLRTILPYPADLPAERARPFGVFELEGRPAPLVKNHRLGLYPGLRSSVSTPRTSRMAVTPDGKAALFLAGGERFHRPVHLAAVGTDGGAVWNALLGPPLLPTGKKVGCAQGYSPRPTLAVSPDGRWAYVAGLKREYYGKEAYPAVFRVPLPTRGPAERFFGDLSKTGAGRDLLGGPPRGLAVDGRGHLLVSDAANDRIVVVSGKDGSFVGAIELARPDHLAVDRRTGHLYAMSLSGKKAFRLVKLESAADGTVLAEAELRWRGNPRYPPVLAVDAGGKRPVVWIGAADRLLRIEDLGGKFGEAVQVTRNPTDTGAFLDVVVDRWRPDPEIYARCGRYHDWWYRFNEATGKIDVFEIPDKYAGGIGIGLRPAPDGYLYGLWYPFKLYRYDREGKRVPFEDPNPPPPGADWHGPVKPSKLWTWVPNSESALTHTLGVRHDGHIFALEPAAPGGRPPKMMHEYLPTGRKLTKNPIIWKVSDAAVGPRFDQAGNIYIAEYVKPEDRPYPDELRRVLGPAKGRLRRGSPQYEAANMYGSILKFSPKGGMVHVPRTKGLAGGPDPFEGKPQLDPSLPVISNLVYFDAGRLKPISVTGALWVHPGISHIGVFPCTCENITFDVDEFGRVWFPDINLYRVRVIDTNGNALAAFGSYGNAESAGPESAVPQPEIAFAWVAGVAVTDRYVYAGDSINRRMLRLRITYAAQADCRIE